MKFIKDIVSFFQYIGKRASESELELYIEANQPKTTADVERLIRQYNSRQLFRNIS